MKSLYRATAVDRLELALHQIAQAKRATADRLRDIAAEALGGKAFDRYVARRREDPKFRRTHDRAKAAVGKRAGRKGR